MSYVIEFPPAEPQHVIAHYQQRLRFETDCADVHDAISRGEADFVLLHVVGNETTFARRHIPGAIFLPHREMTPERMAEWPQETLFVVYCAGPHCNGADRAALILARMGRLVKVMPGGITGWADEQLPFA
ncbi:rhodanese-like domain-containing protein [Atlantibacter hermannii]|uniref:rhodanese-like domain-containing protein n=1 Tax=Atlantibacter hermannii TaxID=565 RepID=UPI0028AD2159|nr:rhodanese-like domain-containing protein [Atlantibacter hermannii]